MFTTKSANRQRLMQETSTWAEDQKVNWSDVGSIYGLTQANRRQLIKEYLAEQGIITAMHEERSTRAPRRAKKKLTGGDISYPSPKVQKQKVKEKIAKGNKIEKTVKEISAKKIPLEQIKDYWRNMNKKVSSETTQMTTLRIFQMKLSSKSSRGV